jgi:hypothetical protein
LRNIKYDCIFVRTKETDENKKIKIMKKESIEEKTIPSLDEIVKNNPPKSDEEIGEIKYEDEDEEEELDTTFPLESWEEQFYDDEGNWIEEK